MVSREVEATMPLSPSGKAAIARCRVRTLAQAVDVFVKLIGNRTPAT
jgi:hypothetical protein